MLWTKERPATPVIQNSLPAPERFRVRLAWYAALVAITLSYLGYNFRLHAADLSAPLCPAHNDSAALLSLVKSIQESGWPWKAERVGAPGVAERFDYPLPEHAHYLTLRILLWSGNTFLAFNLWCLLSYPVVATCSFAVLRALGISRPISFALAIVYTFLPFHAGRAFTHTMLAYYHTVPLILLPTIWILTGRLPFFRPADHTGKRKFAAWNATTGWTLLLAAIVAVSSPYYAFFGCYFLVVAGVYRSFAEGSWRPWWAGLGTALSVCLVGFACTLPFVLAQREQGANPAVAHRHWNEADVYCLKITKLVLPSGAHRVRELGHFARQYNAEEIQHSENRDSLLGFIGVAGFVVLCGRLLMPRAGPTLIGGLSILNIAAVVLGACGGLGGLFNFLVFPQIRCYNRVCVFVAFICLLTVALLVDKWAARGDRRRVWFAAAGLMIFGLWDLTSQRQAPKHAELQKNHDAWSSFVRRMEESLPANAMVFQLPAASYPEAGTPYRMPDYAHLACHSYSRTLRWSFGTNRNRRWDEWQQYVARLTPEQMIRALALSGFAAVYVDRRGFADEGKALIDEMHRLLGREMLASDSGEQLLFSLEPIAKSLRDTLDAVTLEREKNRLLNRPCVLLQDGFFPWAPVTPPEPRRAQHSSTMRLMNPGKESRQVSLSMNWQRRTSHNLEVHVFSPTLSLGRHETVPDERTAFVMDFELPPGEHLLRCDATPKPIGFFRLHVAWSATDIRLTTRD